MEIKEVMKVLWARRVWTYLVVILGIAAGTATIYHVSLHGLKPRESSYGWAEAQFVVDSPKSFIVDMTRDPAGLAVRAQTYTQLLRSNLVRDDMARRADVPANDVVMEGLYTIPGRIDYLPRPAPARSAEVLGESKVYRVTFDATPSIPIVSVYTEAPTLAEAARLTAAGVDAARWYTHKLEADSGIPKNERMHITEATTPIGGVVATKTRKLMAIVALFAVVLAGCLLIVTVDSTVKALRSHRLRLPDATG